MIRTKESVRFSILRPHIIDILGRVESVFGDHGLDCIITCGTEAHGPDDPHTHGFAIDLRSKHVPDITLKRRILEDLRRVTGEMYIVLLESECAANEHYHIQIRKDLWRTMA